MQDQGANFGGLPADECFRIIANFTRDWEYWRLPDGSFLYISPSCERITGYSPADFQRDPDLYLSIVHPDDRPLIQKHRESTRREGDPPQLEFRIIRRDGQERWIGHVCQNVRDQFGRSLGRRGSNRDITIRKQAEEALRRSEAHYRVWLDALPQLAFRADAVGRATHFNQRWREYTGRSQQELMGTGWMGDVHPDDHPRILEQIGQALEDGCEYRAEYRLRYAGDGTYRWQLVRALPVRDTEGRILHWLGTATDIEDRRRAEDLLKSYLDQQSRIVQASAYLLAQTDMGALLAVVARACREIMPARLAFAGQSRPDEPLGAGSLCLDDEPVSDRELAPDHAEQIELLQGMLAVAPSIRLSGDELRHHPQGRRLTGPPFSLRSLLAARLVERDGSQNGLVLLGDRTAGGAPGGGFTAEDEAALAQLAAITSLAMQNLEALSQIETARQELEDRVHVRTAELERRAEQLAHLASELTLTEQRERRRLAQILHDHLQQLLVGAKFGLETLRRHPEDGSQQQSVARVSGLIDQALASSRSLTVELYPPILHESGLKAGLEWLARWLREKHGFELQLEAAPDFEVEREDLRILLFQSVRELLLNVLKHARVTSASVGLSREEEDSLKVVVRDKGIGFDSTKRGWDSRITGGFGLFSIRERLALLGGRFEIESAPRRGTTVTMIAPARGPQPAPRPLPAGAPAREPPVAGPTGVAAPISYAQGEPLRILLVDDHPIMREGLALLLEEEPDLQVVGEASGGRAAIRLATELRPDIILMDINMPDMNGIEATRAILAELPDTHVIGLSMYDEADRAAEMLAAGATAYLSKSGPANALLGAIRSTARAGQDHAP
jgi:PAS domain S-box-containing protein